MDLGLTEIIIAIVTALVGGLWFNGKRYKKEALKQSERAEKAEIENVLVREQVRKVTRQNQIKEEAYEKERQINSISSDVERVPLGINGVHDGQGSSSSGQTDL